MARFLLLLIGLLSFGLSYGQLRPAQPITLTFFQAAQGLNSGQVFQAPINPGVSLGTAWMLKAYDRSDIEVNVQLGYSYQQTMQQLSFLSSDLVYRYGLLAGFHATVLAGGGYMHRFYHPNVVGRGGATELPSVIHQSHLMTDAGFGLGYTFSNYPLELLLRYQWVWQHELSAGASWEKQQFLHFGLSFYPFQHK
ncbi:MAG: hypothetical protein AAFR61_22445 [Bacteroidota bacterium]